MKTFEIVKEKLFGEVCGSSQWYMVTIAELLSSWGQYWECEVVNGSKVYRLVYDAVDYRYVVR